MGVQGMRFLSRVLAIVSCLSINQVWAAGSEQIAKVDRSLWGESLNSPAAFDRASRAEILVFIGLLTDTTQLDDVHLQQQLKLKSVNRDSVNKVSNRLIQILWKNWQAAAAKCQINEGFCPKVASSEELIRASRQLTKTLPTTYQDWYSNSLNFHRQYTYELMRLAALFPKVSSEIERFTDNERNGFELSDRHFLLTFDDGPTNKSGSTDVLLNQLSQTKTHAIFYVLGERLQSRLHQENAISLAKLYQGQCVALHGWQHQSHAKWTNWQQSVLDTNDLVKQTFPDEYKPLFRPPYGQRRSDSGVFFDKQSLTVALWNIDSQDWNSHISAAEAGQRVLNLMLLWRRGVILFHDIHTKAQQAVPWLINNTQQSGIVWDDCRDYK